MLLLLNPPAPLIFPSTGFNESKIRSVRSRSRLQIQSSSPYPASMPSPLLYPNGEAMSSTTPSKAPPATWKKERKKTIS